MASSPVLYVNGRLTPVDDARVSALDRGFTLADGVFETMVAVDARVFRLADHLGRLRQGATLLQISLPPDAGLTAAIEATLRANGHPRSIARLTATRGVDTGRGLAVAGDGSPTLVIRVTPRTLAASPPAGLRVVLAEARRNDMSPLSRIKSLAYTDGVLARLDARRAGADDALFLNTAERLACGTSSNLFVVRDGVLMTPPVSEGVLPGVARRTVLEVAASVGIPCAERPLPLADVDAAQEVFLTNVVTGLVPVVVVEGRPVGRGSIGPVTERLWRAYRDACEVVGG